jgi:hypothetical protein
VAYQTSCFLGNAKKKGISEVTRPFEHQGKWGTQSESDRTFFFHNRDYSAIRMRAMRPTFFLFLWRDEA